MLTDYYHKDYFSILEGVMGTNPDLSLIVSLCNSVLATLCLFH